MLENGKFDPVYRSWSGSVRNCCRLFHFPFFRFKNLTKIGFLCFIHLILVWLSLPAQSIGRTRPWKSPIMSSGTINTKHCTHTTKLYTYSSCKFHETRSTTFWVILLDVKNVGTRRMAIANGTCVSFCNQPKAEFGYLRRVTLVCRCHHPFASGGIWLR